GVSRAQDEQPAGPPPTGEQLANEQTNVLGALERLDQKIAQLAEKLKERQPEQAERLQAAYQAIRERLIKEDMARIAEMLRANQPLPALSEQEQVKADLQALIELLDGARRRRVDDLPERLVTLRKEIEQVKTLEKEQRELNQQLAGDDERREQLASI